MSPNDETASGEGQDAQTTDPVYDFLYQDARRINSFLGQIDPSGHLTGLKQTDADESSSGMRHAGNFAGSVGFAKASGALEDTHSGTQRQASERTYDPLWANAIGLLDILDGRKLVQEYVQHGRVGQFTISKGQLGILDLSLLKAMYANTTFRQMVENDFATSMVDTGLFPIPPKFNGKSATRPQLEREASKQSKAVVDVFSQLPHTVHARLATDDGYLVHAQLQEESLTISPTDLLMKSGPAVPGQWSMLGILDAVPDFDGKFQATAASELRFSNNPFIAIMHSLAELARQLGRPGEAYGMTPLLIFRRVS